MFATGQGSESTGGHSDLVILDDVIGENTIQDSLMPKVRRWQGSTVAFVLNPGGREWVVGTHWDDDDIYIDMRKSKDYDTRVRSCYETDGQPDWNGKPMLFSRKHIEKVRRRPGMTEWTFSCQYMNDPIPHGERRWEQDAEQFITQKEAYGKGVIFILSDPAPLGLSVRGDKDKIRGDAGKDWWSICVVKIRAKGDRQDIILLHGEHAQDWSSTRGFERACQLMQTWRTPYFFNESYTGDSWSDEFMRVARRMGVQYHTEKRQGAWKLPTFKDSYSKNQKNLRFESLCDRNNRGEFYICETCPSSFLYGDEDKTGFLTQIRKWMPLQQGRSNLKYDDDADCVARSTDSALAKIAPRPDFGSQSDMDWLWKDGDEYEEQAQRSRYCAI